MIEDLDKTFAKYRGTYHIGSKSKTSEARKESNGPPSSFSAPPPLLIIIAQSLRIKRSLFGGRDTTSTMMIGLNLEKALGIRLDEALDC